MGYMSGLWTRVGATVLAIAVTAWLAACASSPSMTPGSGSSIFGTWRLTQIEGVDVKAVQDEGGRAPTLTVSVDGMIFGFTGINQLNSSVDLEALARGEFEMGLAATTRMAGSPAAMAMESRFVSGLADATRYTVSNGELTLSNSSRDLLRFVRVEE
ncbi:MAG: META domain-containing protein [Phycisphaeraceae bacterium]|nr:META domain-containing protein [Phycisphaeraceae bacterium]